MKHSLALLVTFLLSVTLYAQAKFEKGYFLNNDNIKTECLIKSKSWQKTPSEVFYKLSETSEIKSFTPPDVKEFAIEGGLHFISEEVIIDISSNDQRDLSDDPNPIWATQRLFLKVLVDGKARLYVYQTASTTRFFYKVENNPIQQLVYKRFLKPNSDNTMESANVMFRQQLYTDVRSSTCDLKTVEKLPYEKVALLDFFIDYNKQSGLPYTKYSRKREKAEFHLRITPGLNYTSVSVNNTYLKESFIFNFGGQFGFRMGIEPELIFPNTNKMLGLVLEPTFQYYKATSTVGTQTMNVQMYTVEFPIGLRFYLYPAKDLKVFLNAFFIPSPTIHPNSDVQYEGYNNLTFGMNNSFAGGAGVNWKRFSAEVRVYSNRKFFSGSTYLLSKYYRASLILGFRIF